MAMHGKKYRAAKEKMTLDKNFSFAEGLAKVKELAYAKFDESVDAHVNLGIDASKGEQVVRGSVLLPYGTGKKIKVIVFAKGDYAEKAEKAGADLIGTDDLVGMVGKLAKVLGPKGLLPNKKVGTVTFDVADIVQDLKKGRVFFKNDKNGIVHFSFGKVSFDVAKLQDNLNSFIRALAASKPSTSKGKFIQKITITSTMGVGIPIAAEDVVKA